MLVLLSKIMLGVSLTGIILVLAQKIPALVQLPEEEAPVLSAAFKKRTQRMAPDFSGVSFEKFLHKILSKSKIVVLRTEHKINQQLRKLRSKNKPEKKKDFGNDEYWDELKKEVNEKNSEE